MGEHHHDWEHLPLPIHHQLQHSYHLDLLAAITTSMETTKVIRVSAKSVIQILWVPDCRGQEE